MSKLFRKWPRIAGVQRVVLTTIVVSSLLVGVVGYALPAIAGTDYSSDNIFGGDEAYLAQGLYDDPMPIPDYQAGTQFQPQPGKPFLGPRQGQPFGYGRARPNRPGNPWKLRQDRGIRIKGIIKAVEDNKVVLKTRFGAVLIAVTPRTKVIEIRRGLEPVGVQVGQRAIAYVVPGERIPRARLLVVFAIEPVSPPADSEF